MKKLEEYSANYDSGDSIFVMIILLMGISLFSFFSALSERIATVVKKRSVIPFI